MSAARAAAGARFRTGAPSSSARCTRRLTTPIRLPGNPLLRALASGLFRWRYWRGLRRPPLGRLAGIAPGRLLDVGSGRGDLGVTLGERGWDVSGLEPAAEGCAEARGRGVATVQGTLTTAAGEVGRDFDAVVFQHSLEHVAEPLDDLVAARALLRGGGLVLISLPNFGSWQARRFGSTGSISTSPVTDRISPSRHRVAAPPCGLEPTSTDTSTSADGLPMSLQYQRFGGRRYREGPALLARWAWRWRPRRRPRCSTAGAEATCSTVSRGRR